MACDYITSDMSEIESRHACINRMVSTLVSIFSKEGEGMSWEDAYPKA